MDLTYSDLVYMAIAFRNMLRKDLNRADRDAYEKLWYKCKLSRKGQRIKLLFAEEKEEES